MGINVNKYEMKLLSSLAKVFPDTEPRLMIECNRLTALKCETVSFQVAFTGANSTREVVIVEVSSPIRDLIKVRTVDLVPVGFPCYPLIDDNYLRTTPGLYPDILNNLLDNQVYIVPGQWRALWIDITTNENSKPGCYPIKISLKNDNDELCFVETKVKIIDVCLPKQELIHTRWFHADCLADFYNVEVFSENHWEIVENFISTAVSRGVNMILTPTFTPPLDTYIGGERTTVQLVNITVTDGKYTFCFEKLKRWVDMCLENGVEYFEMAHLFTQWGAKAAPKVMATVDGEYKRIFGWDTPAVGGEYTLFLNVYLPELIAKLKEWGIADKTYFHISDEPQISQLEDYLAAKESVIHHLKDFNIIDALSNYEFYEKGVVSRPIPANDHIEPFLENNVPNLWTYYCCGQFYKVSNYFLAMPSARNRIFGTQLYKFNIEGILHWGYNFYNAQYSKYHINPYEITDAANAFPSGDPFLVYPGKDGKPVESIRMMVLYNAITDLRAMKLLEYLTSNEFVMDLIEGDLGSPITFSEYPKSDMYLISLRNKINAEIEKRLKLQ